MASGDVYISADVEADGPIPGPYSMLAFGLAVAATFDGATFETPLRHSAPRASRRGSQPPSPNLEGSA